MGDAQVDRVPADASGLNVLRWPEPTSKVDSPMGLAELLTGLQLLATDQARKQATSGLEWAGETPASMQVIKSGALAITTTWTKRVAGFGGVGGLVTVAAGVIAGFRKEVGDPIAVALIAAAAVVFASSAIAIALFVKGDLEARGRATAARHAARGDVAAAFLAASGSLARVDSSRPAETALADEILQALSAFPHRMTVSTKDHPEPRLVSGVRRTGEGQELQVPDDWVLLSTVTSYTTTAENPAP